MGLEYHALLCLAVPLVLLVLAGTMSQRVRKLAGQVRQLERDVAELQLTAAKHARLLGHVETPVRAPPAPDAADQAEAPPVPAAAGRPVPVPQAASESEPEPEPGPILGTVAEPGTGPIAPRRPPMPPHAPAVRVPPPKGPSISLEEQLGARLPVWIGSIALALAGTFLFKWTIDQGLLGPTVRVALGVVFGVVLLTVGEVLPRASQRIAAGLSAAGIAVLYASFLAATSRYDLVGPTVGFAVMTLTTAAAVGLSLRRGEIVAAVGLVGGFLTPYLVGSRVEPEPRGLFAYLLVLQLGLLVVTRRRGWWQLAGLTLTGGALWVLAWLVGPFELADAAWLNIFVLANVAAFMTAALHGAADEEWGDARVSPALTWAAAAVGLTLTALTISFAGFRTMDWAFVAILVGGCLFLGRLARKYEALPWLAALIVAALLVNWAWTVPPVAMFLWTVIALGALISLGAYALQWDAPRPLAWAALSGATAVTFLLIAHNAPFLQRHNLPWGATALALGALYVGLAVPVAQRRRIMPGADEALAALAAAATFFTSLAVPLELERQWLAVAWSLEVAALVWIARQIELPALRSLAWLLAGLVGLRLFLNPEVISYPIGTLPILNWLLYGYGIPLAAFAGAAYLCYRQDEQLSRALQWGALVAGFYLVTLQVRQWFHPGAMDDNMAYLAEWGTVAIAWLVGGLLLLRAFARWHIESLNLAGLGLVALGTALVLLGPGLVQNPLWTHHAVGAWKVVNHLPYVYGLPAALVLAAAWLLRERGDVPRPASRTLEGAALALLFLLVTLEVRQAYHGTYLDTGVASSSENYAYSLSWVLFGTLLLVVGVTTRGQFARYASLAVMFLTVGKVFLYDVGALADLYRVFSFLGLGLSLLLLAYLYQRFVFTETTG